MAGQAYARKGDFKTAQGFLCARFEGTAGFSAAQDPAGDDPGRHRRQRRRHRQPVAQALKSGGDNGRALATLTLVNLRSNKFKEALDSSNKLIAANPALPIGYNMRGAAELGLQNMKAAEADFRTAAEKDPKFTEARRNLAQVYMAQNRLGDAKAELTKVVSVDAKDTRAMMLLAVIAQRGGNTAERIQWLTQATTVDPNAIGPRMALAQAYVQGGQVNRAVTAARALERDFPTNPAAVEMVGMTSLAARNANDAETSFTRLVSMVPKEAGPRILLARVQAEQKHAADARRTLADAIANVPKDKLLPVYVDSVRLEQSLGQPADADRMLAKFRAAYPKSNIPDMLVGDYYMSKQQGPQAIAAYMMARKIASDSTVAMRLSTAYQAVGQPQNAISALQTYLKSNPNDSLAGAAMAEAQMQLRQYKPAIATYEALLPKGGNKAPAILNNLAWAYHQVGDPRATATAQRALALAPNSPEIIDTLGTILVDTRQDKIKGQALIDRAVKLRPADPNMRFHLAVARVANHRPKEALQELALALKAPRFDSRAGALALQQRLASGK